MSTNLRQIAYQAQRDIGNLWPGMTSSADVEADILAKMNEQLDNWAMQRFFIYQGSVGNWTALAAFPDMTTAYNFAPGNLQALERTCAQIIAPMMRIYRKMDIGPELMAQINKEASEAVKELQGVGAPLV